MTTSYLYDDAEAGLKHHDEDRLRTVRIRVTAPVADRLLGLDGEEQGCGEVLQVLHASLAAK